MYYLASDVGGTFVDLVAVDTASNNISVLKVSSTGHSSEGILRGIQTLVRQMGIAVSELDAFVHGFTIATNAWLTRRGGRVVMVTTKGFRDVLEIGDQRRPKLYSLTQRAAPPLVRRSLVVEIDERIDAFGDVVTPIDPAELRRVVEAVRGLEPEAVALSLMFSFLNASHERELAAALREALPGVLIYLSADINPQIEEYLRANTTAIAAYVGPAVHGYVSSLEGGLRGIGFGGPLMLMRSDGGVATPQATRINPATMLLSGPAGGVIAASALGAAIGAPDIVTFDMGGTSADFSLIAGGVPGTSSERWIDGQALRSPMLDIETISAGGGSIASVDHAGGLHVGPQSAGSKPGPACYGRGGTAPTLTDAIVTLGIIHPDDFADGAIILDSSMARAAIRTHVAEPLGLGVDEAALGMISLSCGQMRQAIRSLTIERGFDIRRFSLFAFGGAGSIFAALMEEELGMRSVLIPARPGVFAAMGLLLSDIRHADQRSFAEPLERLNPAVVAERLLELGRDLDAALEADGVPPDRRRISFSANMRYAGQFHDINIALPAPEGADWWDESAVATLFHATHERQYGHSEPADSVEFVALRGLGVGIVDKPSFAPLPGRAEGPPPVASRRPVLFPGAAARQDCPVYRRADLLPGHVLAGPAIITQSDTTVLILPRQTGRIDEYGVIAIQTETQA